MAHIIRHHEPREETLLPEISRWEPFRMMRDFLRWDPFREMERALVAPSRMGFLPEFDVKETKSAYVFRSDVPGVREQDLEVSVAGNRITVSGKREEEEREEGESYFACERAYGSFSRGFTLPEGADIENVSADLREGVLTLTVPKKAEVQAKKIPVGGKEKKAKA